MENIIKLRNCNINSFDLYQYYLNATSKTFENEILEFETCLESLKDLVEKQYDFEWLAQSAQVLGITRKEIKSLADEVCMLLGERIDELCKYSKEPIVTKPTKFEGYCPFSSESIVAYGTTGNSIEFDGKKLRIIDTKLESTPYYNIYCSAIEL